MDKMNIAAAIINISAFGVKKLYIIGSKVDVCDFESSRNNGVLNRLSIGENKWVFVKYFGTTKECIDHLKKDLYTIVVTLSHIKVRKT